ncbi:MAG: YhbY family RNA-binding protein [Myxococcota bacterium]
MTEDRNDDPPATDSAGTPTVTSKARSHLRSLAHALPPTVRIGATGLTESVLEAVRVALRDHELIKVKLEKSFTADRKASARELADAVAADLTQVIGRVVVLYRPRPAKAGDKRPRIQLPAAAE